MNKSSMLSVFFDMLNIKYTYSYLNKLYKEHPNKNNLLGLSQILSKYEIDNIAVRVKEKEKAIFLNETEMPFIVNFGNDFIVVNDMNSIGVHYIWNGEKKVLAEDKFINVWNGVVLVADPDSKSTEPNYHNNKKEELVHLWKKRVLSLILLMLIGITIITSNIYASLPLLVSLLINFVGLWISYLLLLKQLYVESDYADRICSVFHQSDCNNILETEASKLFGILSWSEVGAGYYFANIIILLFFTELYPYLTLINICALPYTIWSVWYQKWVAKQWCPLCLLVQITLWGLFINNLLFGFITWPNFEISSFIIVGCIYAIPILILNLLLPKIGEVNKIEDIMYGMNSVKAERKVFDTLLNTMQQYDVDKSVSSVLWGDIKADNLLTIVTNPHCNPCAKMHRRLQKLLEETKNGFCIQYIYSSFNDDLYESNRLLVAQHQKLAYDDYMHLLDNWFRKGKNNRADFYDKHKYDPNDENLMIELKKHDDWLKATKIVKTPTVLFNGLELPHHYKIEDLLYFTRNNDYRN